MIRGFIRASPGIWDQFSGALKGERMIVRNGMVKRTGAGVGRIITDRNHARVERTNDRIGSIAIRILEATAAALTDTVRSVLSRVAARGPAGAETRVVRQTQPTPAASRWRVAADSRVEAIGVGEPAAAVTLGAVFVPAAVARPPGNHLGGGESVALGADRNGSPIEILPLLEKRRLENFETRGSHPLSKVEEMKNSHRIQFCVTEVPRVCGGVGPEENNLPSVRTAPLLVLKTEEDVRRVDSWKPFFEKGKKFEKKKERRRLTEIER